MFCHTCISAVKTGKVKLITGNVQESTFVSVGFSNWKDTSRCFNNHEKSTTHKTAVEMVITLQRTTGNVGEKLSSTLATKKRDNRHYLLKVADGRGRGPRWAW